MHEKRKNQRQKAVPRSMTIRFNQNDVELQNWLEQFSQTNDMTRVVKLALYTLAGLQPDPALLALVPVVNQKQNKTAQSTSAGLNDGGQATSDALAAVMQELSALREELVQQRGELGTSPRSPDISRPATGSIASSGLDMSSPRKRREKSPDSSHHSQPNEAVFDADEARRKLLASIKAFGKEMREGH